MKPETKSKLKTTVFWSSIASALILLAQSIAILFGYEISQEKTIQIMAVVNSALTVFSISGILVNPEKVDSYQAFKVKMMKK